MSDPIGPCAVYTRGISYSDEYYFVDPDPMLDAALRSWRETGETNEVLSLLQHQDENAEYADLVDSIHPSFAEAELASRAVLIEMIRGLTFVDFGFSTFGVSNGSARWYSTRDDDEAWSSIVDDAVTAKETDDIDQLLAWCDRHNWPHPSASNPDQLKAIAERAMEDCWSESVDDAPESFLADIVAEQLQAASRDDLLVDLWATLVGPMVFVGPPPSEKRAKFDLRKMSMFKERNIDTSPFSADSLDPTSASTDPTSASTTALHTSDPAASEPLRKGLFSRIFGK